MKYKRFPFKLAYFYDINLLHFFNYLQHHEIYIFMSHAHHLSLHRAALHFQYGTPSICIAIMQHSIYFPS